ncbi:hypothetical protein ACJX0J_020483, partial [Zea mays]
NKWQDSSLSLLIAFTLEVFSINYKFTISQYQSEFVGYLLYFYICDRTNMLGESAKNYSRDLFLFLYFLLIIVAAMTSFKVHQDKSSFTGKSVLYLNRHQSEEWKGWMQDGPRREAAQGDAAAGRRPHADAARQRMSRPCAGRHTHISAGRNGMSGNLGYKFQSFLQSRHLNFRRTFGVVQDAKDTETLANLTVCSLNLGKPATRYLNQLKLAHPDLVKRMSSAAESFDRACQAM